MSPDGRRAAGDGGGPAATRDGGGPPVAAHDGPVAVFGGVYSNHRALRAVLEDARDRGAEAFYCLGDLGAFGPNPDRVPPLLLDAGATVVRGNYDDSLARGLEDCQCGYTDPKDNYYAQISYDYTFNNTSEDWKDWMADLPPHGRFHLEEYEVYLCHGSPRRTNEFLWESTTPDHFLDALMHDYDADVILATHTGMHWHRRLPGNRHFINVGVIGRPANDGNQHVWASLIQAQDGRLSVDFVPIHYDNRRLAREMEEEGLPDEFVETIRTGWWTSCLEVLPAKERAVGIH